MPRLIVLNQTSNPAFDDWLQALSAEVGTVELWTGNRPPTADGPVIVRRGPAYNRASAASRLRAWLAFTLWTAWRLLWRREAAALIVVTNPPFTPLAAWLLSRLRQYPYALLEWDIYPDILQPMGLLKESHPLYRFWRGLHGRALRDAAAVVTLGDEMAEVLRATAAVPVTVVPNWVDTQWLRPQPRNDNPFVQAHGLQDKFVILYSGNLGATHAIETIIATAELLRGEARFQFVIIGEGSKRPLAATAVTEGRTPNLLLLPYQPAESLPWTLSGADAAVVTLGQGYERLSMPSKTYNLLAAGNALLGISQPPNDLALTIARHGCGANFAPDDAPGIAAWLRGLADEPAALAAMRANARRAAEACYQADLCIAQMTAAFRPVWTQGETK